MKKCQYAVSGKLQKEGKKVYTFGSSCAFTCWLYSRKRDSKPSSEGWNHRVEEDECLSENQWGFVGCSKFPNSKLFSTYKGFRRDCIRHYIMILLSVSVYINSSMFQKHSMTSLRVASTPADE
ncbi:hypothetical protein HID58_091921 [Brassica napus]|uniref:Uncharacterized protein n=1 Tax=Brassica napus TaxID=3708 RepID=A0ABQ7X0E1_BRANA|nr:hypothetical protein HID58_091921 [Brassica napus]